MTTLDLLLDVDTLKQHLNDDNLLIVQVTSQDVFNKIHIPGAVHVAPGYLMSGEPPAKGSVPTNKKIEALLQNIGFTGKQHVVVYDDEGGGWAGRFIWTLDYISFSNYSYLDGGLHAWHAAKLPLTNGAQTDTAISNYQIQDLNQQVRARSTDILTTINDDDFAIWDARSPAEYSGTQVFAMQGGHIPGAKNLEWTELMDTQNNLRLLPLDQIQNRLNELGLSKDKNLVTHCQSHHRSGLTYLVAKILNYPNIRAYDGSWSDWGNNLELPVEV